jgi:hypothetical protein
MARDLRTCCGLLMTFQDVFGIRVWHCSYRLHHPVLYENPCTGEVIADHSLKVSEQLAEGAP